MLVPFDILKTFNNNESPENLSLPQTSLNETAENTEEVIIIDEDVCNLCEERTQETSNSVYLWMPAAVLLVIILCWTVYIRRQWKK